MRKMADDYNMDASKINDLVSDFSATSEELVASISNITEAIDGITSASNDSAAGTTNIAQKIRFYCRRIGRSHERG